MRALPHVSQEGQQRDPARLHAASCFSLVSFNQGEKWIQRFSVLSADHLSFSKLHIPRGRDLSDGAAAAINTTVVHKWVMQTNAAEMSSARLREVFERFDADKNGTLDVEECGNAMVELNMVSCAAKFRATHHNSVLETRQPFREKRPQPRLSFASRKNRAFAPVLTTHPATRTSSEKRQPRESFY